MDSSLPVNNVNPLHVDTIFHSNPLSSSLPVQQSITFSSTGLTYDYNVYLKVDANSLLEYSTDGTNFTQVGQALTKYTSIQLDLGTSSNDTFHIDGSLANALGNTGAQLSLNGGIGTNTLFGPDINTTWNITGQNSGNVAGIQFNNIDNLEAGANNYATFDFGVNGSLSGIADGGAGNLGTLIIDGGNYSNEVFTAAGPHSGTIETGSREIQYAGLAPIFDNSNTSDRVFNTTTSNDQILVSKAATTGETTIASGNNTFESISFLNPSNSLTINGLQGNDTITLNALAPNFTKSLSINANGGQDSVIFANNLTLNGGNLTVNAENITVNSGVTIDTTQSGGTAGTVTFTSTDTESGLNASGQAQINLTGATIKAGNINISASSTVSGSLSYLPVAFVNLTSAATIAVINTQIQSSGNVTLSTSSVVTGAAKAQGLSTYINTAADAATATSIINSSAITHISGSSSLNVQGNLSVTATNSISDTTSGDASPSQGGAGIAVSTVTDTTQAYIDGSSSQSISASSITLSADSNNNIATTSKASTGGATQNSQNLQSLTQNLAKTSDGQVNVAGALAFNNLTDQTQAYISSANSNNPTTVSTSGKLTIHAASNNSSSAIADGSNVGSNSVGVGVAVAINLININNNAYIGGNTYTNAGGIQIEALTPTNGSFTTTATSGSGSSSKVGVAGALAVHNITTNSQAQLQTNAVVNANGGAVSLTATNEGTSTVTSQASQGGSGTVGVGASMELDIAQNQAEAVLQNQVVLNNAGTLTLAATSNNTNTTSVQAGTAGGIAVNPAVGLTIVNNNTLATIGTGGLLTVGSLSATAQHSGNTSTTVDATAAGDKVGIGASIALNIIDDSTTANTGRSITATTGGVSFGAFAYASTGATAKASAAGAAPPKSTDKQQIAQDQADTQISSSGDPNATQDQAAISGKAKTSDGSVSIAAGLALNLATSSTQASLADGLVINTPGQFTLATSNETDASAIADGTAVDGSNSTGIGAAVALNIVNLTNTATIGASTTGNANVTAKGVSVSAKTINPSLGGDGISDFTATATSGAGATGVGVAGSFALNYIGSNSSLASINSGAIVNAGGGDVSITAQNQTQTATTANAIQSAGSSSPKVGVGASFALDLEINNNATATIQNNATLQNAGNLILSATSNNTSATSVQAGAAGGTAVSPAVGLTIVNNNTLATIGTGGLLTVGSLNATAQHSGNSSTTVDATAAGDKVGIGAAISLNIIDDSTTANTGRSITANTGGVSFGAFAYDSTGATAKASAAGAAPPKSTDTQQTAQDQADTQISSAGDPNATQDQSAISGKAKTSDGSVSIAAGLALNLATSSTQATLADGLVINTPGEFTLATSNETDASAIADGTAVDGSNSTGIGAAVALNIVNLTNTATIGASTTGNANVTAKGVSISAKTSNPSLGGDGISDFTATATSGAGASTVGVAGSFALNYIGSNSSLASINSGAIVNAGGGDVSITAQNQTKTVTAANAIQVAGASSSPKVGVGASFALDLEINNNATATIQNNATLQNAGNLILSATSNNTSATSVQAGAAGGTAVSPAVGLTIVNNNTLATIGTGGLLTVGSLNATAQHSGNSSTTVDATVAGDKVGIGAAISLNIIDDSTTANTSRSITASTGGVSFGAFAYDSTGATAKASAAGAAPPKSTDTQQTAQDQADTQISSAGDPNATQDQSAISGKAKTSDGSVSIAAGLALNLATSSTQATLADGLVINTPGQFTLATSNETDASAIADGTAVDGSNSTGIGAAVALNIVNLTNTATIGASTTGNANVTAKGVSISAKTSNPSLGGDGISDFTATATSGAGASTVGVAGSFALNYIGSNSSLASINSGAIVNAGGGDVSITAQNQTKTVTAANAIQVAGASSSPKVGVGASFALDLEINNNATATIQNNATLQNAGNLILSATSNNTSATSVQAGAAGGTAVSPAVGLTIVNNNTLATIGTGGLLTVGSLNATAQHSGNSSTTVDATVAGDKVGIGAAISLNIIDDSTTANTSRSITASTGGVSFGAFAYDSTGATAKASAAGAAPPKSTDTQQTAQDQADTQISSAGDPNATQDQSAISGKAKTSDGSVSIAAGLALNLATSSTQATLADGLVINTPGQFTLATSNETDASAIADGTAVDGSNSTGIGAAVALNIVNLTNTATIGASTTGNANVTAKGVSVSAKTINPSLGGDGISDFTATATSGAGATGVGVAGSFALNYIGSNSSLASINSGAIVNAGGGDVSITAQNQTQTATTANAIQSAGSSSPKVGVGASFALDLEINNNATATIQNNATLQNAGNLILSATSNNTSATSVQAGAAGGTAVSPAVGLTIVNNNTLATIGTGGLLTVGSLNATAQHSGNSSTTVDATAAGDKVGVGAAISLNIIDDSTTANTGRSITATTGGVSFGAFAYASTGATAKASAAGAAPPKSTDTQQTAQDQADTQISSAGDPNATQDQSAVSGKAKSNSDGSVSIAAGLALNLDTSTTSATLASNSVINTVGEFTLSASNETDGSAIADGSAVDGSNKAGIGVAVALNIVTASNQANLGSGAQITAKGVAVEAQMSNTSLGGDGVSNFNAQSTSGAGGTTVGVAGSFALNYINNSNQAIIQSGANVNAGSGDITLIAANNEVDNAKATSQTTSGKVGVGASIGMNLLLSNQVTAQVQSGVTLSGSGALTIDATSGRIVNTDAEAGSSGGVAISPAVALAIVTNNTTAQLGSGSGTLNLTGNASIQAEHTGSVITSGNATAAGANVAVGAIVGVNVINDNTTATVLRNLTTSSGSLVISSDSNLISSAEILASASGNSQNGRNADDEASAQSGQSLPKAQDSVNSANTQASSESSAPGGSGGGSQGGSVGVAAAVGVNWQIATNTAIVGNNISLITNGGGVTVSATSQTSATARAIGTSLSSQSKVNVSATLGLNIANITNTASVGSQTVINTQSNNGQTGNITIQAITPNQQSNEFVVWGLAASAGSSANSKASVAGSVGVNVLNFNNQALIGNGTQLVTSGGVSLTSNSPIILQNLAIAGAFSSSNGGGAVGGAISVNTVTQNTTSVVGTNVSIDASGSVNVSSTSSVSPRTVSIQDLIDVVDAVSGGIPSINIPNIPGINQLFPQLQTLAQPIVNDLNTIINNAENSFAGAGTALSTYYSQVSTQLNSLVNEFNTNTITAQSYVTQLINLAKAIAPNIPGTSQLLLGFENVAQPIVDDLNTFISNGENSNPTPTLAASYQQASSQLNSLIQKYSSGAIDSQDYLTQVITLANSVAPNLLQNLQFSQVVQPLVDNLQSVLDSGKNLTPALAPLYSLLSNQLDSLVNQIQQGQVNLQSFVTQYINLTQSLAVNFFQNLATNALNLLPFSSVAIGGAVSQGKLGVGGSVIVDIFNVTTTSNVGSGAQINQGVNTKAGTNQSFSLTASDNTNVENVAGGLGVGTGGVGIGIGVDVEILNRNVGTYIASLTPGASKITAAQGVSIQSSTTENIYNLTLSGAESQTLGIGGTVSVNSITNSVTAGSSGTITTQGNVNVTATNNSTIQALAGGFALAASLSSGGSNASFGAAVALNNITSTTQATIDAANVTASGALNINATSTTAITSISIAGSGSVSNGSGSSLSFAAGASIAINTINSTITAAIDSSSAIQVGGNSLSISAIDNSTIKAFSLGGALAVNASSGSTGGTTAIGVSAATNTINNTTAAYIDSSTVGSSNNTNLNLNIQALSTDTISAQSIAVAIAVSQGSTGVSLSGGGAGAGNYILTKTNAYVNNSNLTNNIGNVALTANNTANIDATVVAISGSISVGSSTGVGASIGAAVANNYIGYDQSSNRNPSQVQAYIQNSSIKANGDLTLNALANENIIARVGAGSVAVAASTGGTGLSGSGSGVVTTNKIASQIQAFVNGDGATGIQTKSATLTATDSSQITANAGAASIAVAAASTTGGSLSIGVAVATNLISNQIGAFINNATHSFKTTTGNITLSATSNPTISANSVAASIAVGAAGTTGVGISGAGAAAINTILTNDNAYISGSVVTSAGAVNITATSTPTISALITAVSAAVGAGGTTGVGVSIGAAVADNYIGYDGSTAQPTIEPIDVQAYIQNSSLIANQGLTLTATSSGSIAAGVGAGSVAVGGAGTTGVAASGSGVVTLNDIATLVQAFINGDGATGIQAASIALTASDTSSITANAGAASLSIAGGGTTGVAVSIGVSVASNLISNQIAAYVNNASHSLKTTTGNIALSATTNPTISAISVAASLAAGGGGTAGVNISGAGAGAINTILTNTLAYIAGSVVTSAGAVSLTATNIAAINATIAAVSVSSGGGGTAGVGASIGAAVADNYIGYNGSTRQPAEVEAYIQNSSVTAPGNLTLTALNSGTINAGVGAGSAAISGGGTAGVAASGSGVSTENSIATLVEAFIDGDGATGIQAASVTLTANDTSSITANAGAASIAASFGGTAGVALSIGVSLASNLISNQVAAYINNASHSLKTTTGDVTLTANSNPTIQAISVAASLAASFGGTAGVSISGAGAEADNTILTNTVTYIAGSVVNSAGAVSLTTTNTATISATIAAVSASVSGGGTAGVGISIGAAVATNLIGYDQSGNSLPAEVEAYILNSSVNAAGALTLSAIAQETINAGVGAGSAAVSGGGTAGVSGSGSGVSTTNKVGSLIYAYINGDGATGIQAKSVSLTAKDTSSITANAGAASIAASFSGTASVSLSIGVALAHNVVTNQVEAYIQNANHFVKTTTGDVSLSATTNATINAVAVAASLAAGISGTAGIGVSGAGAESTNNISTKTDAYTQGSVINSAGAVNISAQNTSAISATIAAASVAVGVSGTAGVAASIGVAIARNEIGWGIDPTNTSYKYTTGSGTTSLNQGDRVLIAQGPRAGDIYQYIGNPASINLQTADYGNTSNWQQVNLAQIPSEVLAYVSSSSINAIGALSLTSLSNSTINATVASVSVAVSGGIGGASVSGAGVGTDNKIATNVQAYINGDGITGISASNVSLTATDTSSISTNADAVSLAATFAIGAAISIGVSSATNEINDDVSAYIQNISKGLTATSGGVQLTARDTSTITATSVAASAAAGLVGVAGAGAAAINTIGDTSNTDIANSVQVKAVGNVTLTSSDNSTIESLAGQFSAGTTAAIGVSVATNTISNQITAEIANSQVTSNGGIALSATSTNTIESAAVGGSVSGTVSVAGAVTLNKITDTTSADTKGVSSLQAAGAVTLTASDNSNIQSLAGQLSVSGVAGVGAAVATNNIANSIIAAIGGTTVTSGSVSLSATSNGYIGSIAAGGSGAGGFAAGGAVTLNNIANLIEADINSSSSIKSTGSISLTATDTPTIESLSGQLSVSGGASIGASVATNNITSQVIAEISGSNVTSTSGGVNLSATSTGTINSKAAGGAGAGAFAAGGAVTVNNISNVVRADITNQSTVNAVGDVTLGATNSATIQSLAGQIVGAGGAAIGASVAVNNSSGTTQAYISGSTVTSTTGNVNAIAQNTGIIGSSSAGASVSGYIALTGSVSVNNIANTTTAYASNATISAGNSVQISATDTSTINSYAGQISAGIGAAGVGAAVAYNNIGNTVTADVQADPGKYTTINAAGNVIVSASSTGTINTIAVGGSAGLFVGAGASVAVNQMNNNTSAYVQNSNIIAKGSVGVLANSLNTMVTNGGTVSLGFISLGGTIAVNNLANTTNAYVNNSGIQANGNQSITIPTNNGTGGTQALYGVGVTATSQDNLGVTIGSGDAGAFAFVASVAVNNFQDTTQAYVNNNSNVSALSGASASQPSVYITAFNNSNVNVNAGTAGGGLAAAGVGVNITTMNNTTAAYIDSSSDLTHSPGSVVNATKDLIVQAITQKSVTSNVVSLGGGGISVQGAVSIINVGSGMSSQDTQSLQDKNGNSDLQNTLSKQLQDLNGMGKDSTGKQNINTNNNIAAIFGASAPVSGTTAFIRGTASASGNLTVNASETTNLNVSVGSLSAGLISLGGAVGVANITHNASAYVGDLSHLSGGNITIESTGSVGSVNNSTKVTAVAGSAGLVGLGAAVADLYSTNNSNAYIGNNVTVSKALNLSVASTSYSNLNAQGLGASYGLAAAGVVIGNVQENGTTQAYIGNGDQIQNTNNLNVTATANELVTSTVQASSGGIISGDGGDTHATVNPTISAYIGTQDTINVSQDVNVLSVVTVEGDAATKGGSYGGVAVGLAFSAVNSNPIINTYVGTNTNITAGGNVTISSSLGNAPVTPNTTFNPATAVSNTANTITFSSNDGLQTGDTVIYSNGGGNSIGGLVNQGTYSVIAVNSNTIELGSTFDAATVNTTNNTITFPNGDNFTNGQQVIYEAPTGTTSIGGLVSGQKYYVVVVNSNTIQLTLNPNAPVTTEATSLSGITTGASGSIITPNQTQVVTNGTTTNPTGNQFQNGDTVTYQNHFALFTIDTSQNIPNTNGQPNIFNSTTGVIASNGTIHSASHGFATGDQVVYTSSGAALGGLVSGQTYYVIKVDNDDFQLSATYGGSAIIFSSVTAGTSGEITAVSLNTTLTQDFTSTASNTITLANHGFTTGEAVTYQGSGIGLINNTTYYVNVINANQFQLSATKSGPVITLTASSGIQSLTVASSLQQGATYYVENSTASGFQLAQTAGGPALTINTTGVTGSGTDYFFIKQSIVALTSAGVGTQNLHLVLDNTTATGTSHSLSSGASIVVPTPGNQIFSAYSQASSGGAIAGSGSTANISISPTMKTYLDTGAAITATGNVTVQGLSNVQTTGAASTNTGGIVGVGVGNLTATITNNNTTSINTGATIQAAGNVTINGQSGNGFNIESDSTAGGLIPVGTANATVNINHNTITTIANQANISSQGNTLIQSSSNTTGSVKANANGGGLIPFAYGTATANVNGVNETDINAATVVSRGLTVNSSVDNLNVNALGLGTAGGLIGVINATSNINLNNTRATTNINSGASLKADTMNIDAVFNNVNTNSTALAHCDGLGGDTDSFANNSMNLTANVYTDPNSTLTINSLNVKSGFNSFNNTTYAHSKLAWSLNLGFVTITMDVGKPHTSTNISDQSVTNFNSTVIREGRQINPVLVIGTNGQASLQSANVNFTNTGTAINVGNISATGSGGVTFSSGAVATGGSFTDNGKYSESYPAFDTVLIQNYSNENLIINNINTISTNTGLSAPDYSQVNVSKTITATTASGSLSVNPTVVTIDNFGTSDLILAGVINNPHDRTILYSGGDIFSQGSTENVITRDLTMTAVNGSIGSSTQRIAAQLDQGYSPVTTGVPSSSIYLSVLASQSDFLDLTAKSLDNNPVTVNVNKMTASNGQVNLKIEQTTNTTNSPITALYKFTDVVNSTQNITTGSNITINAGNTTTNIQASDIFLGTSNLLNVISGGSINIQNTPGTTVNIQQATSSASSVTISGTNLVLTNNALVQATDLSLTASSLIISPNAQVQVSDNATFLVGNYFLLNPTASITATNNVVIQADYNNQSTTGSTVTINGAINAKSLAISGNGKSDTFNIATLTTTTNLATGGGNDTVNIGNGGLGTALSAIQSKLNIIGGSSTDNSTLNIDDSQDTSSTTGVLTDTSLTGLGMGQGIYYSGFKTLDLKLGKGTNNFTLLNTSATTNIDASASANNNFIIGPTLDTSGNVLSQTVNGNTIPGTSVLGTNNPTTITYGQGTNSFQINRNLASLKIQGNGGTNNFIVSTPISYSALLPNATVDLTQALGNSTVTINRSSLQENVVNNGSSINVVNSRLILLPPNYGNPVINSGSTTGGSSSAAGLGSRTGTGTTGGSSSAAGLGSRTGTGTGTGTTTTTGSGLGAR